VFEIDGIGVGGAAGRSRLIVLPGCVFELAHEMPNAWYRFWARVLLGWKWEALPCSKS